MHIPRKKLRIGLVTFNHAKVKVQQSWACTSALWRPFGGLLYIMRGVLRKLPPVQARGIFQHSPDESDVFSSNINCHDISCFPVRHIVQQNDVTPSLWFLPNVQTANQTHAGWNETFFHILHFTACANLARGLEHSEAQPSSSSLLWWWSSLRSFLCFGIYFTAFGIGPNPFSTWGVYRRQSVQPPPMKYIHTNSHTTKMGEKLHLIWKGFGHIISYFTLRGRLQRIAYK